MFSGRTTHAMLRLLDRIPGRQRVGDVPVHLIVGRRGEEDAYFYLRREGYVMVARNYRTARHRGEIDLIGWDKDVLCFIEVKTRTTRDVKPAEAAVDRKKRHDLRVVIRDYLRTLPRRQFPEPPQWRFDVITVYYDSTLDDVSGVERTPLLAKAARSGAPRANSADRSNFRPTFELFQNASLSS